MLLAILKVVLTIVEVVVCMLLITAILIQKSKSQGAGLAFGAGMGETLFGGQIGNVMTKVTVVLAIMFLVNTAALGFLATRARYRTPDDPGGTTEQNQGSRQGSGGQQGAAGQGGGMQGGNPADVPVDLQGDVPPMDMGPTGPAADVPATPNPPADAAAPAPDGEEPQPPVGG